VQRCQDAAEDIRAALRAGAPNEHSRLNRPLMNAAAEPDLRCMLLDLSDLQSGTK
jgi:hypothetical protein